MTPALLALCLAVACAGDDVRDSGDSAAVVTAEPGAASTAPPGVGTVPLDTVRAPAGTWTVSLAETKLRSARLLPVQVGAVNRAGFAVPGLRYTLGASQLELFLYADAIARGRDTDALDRSRLVAGMTPQPVLIADGNLAALLYSTDPAIVSRVRASLRTERDDGSLEPAGIVPPRGAPEGSP